MYNGVWEILSKRNMLGKMNLFPIFERYNSTVSDKGTKFSKQLFAFKGSM